jgi:hypothetical protein
MKTITAIWQVFALAAAISLAFSNARADPICSNPRAAAELATVDYATARTSTRGAADYFPQ